MIKDKCSKCNHKEICEYKKLVTNTKEKIKSLEIGEPILIELSCKYYQDIPNILWNKYNEQV